MNLKRDFYALKSVNFFYGYDFISQNSEKADSIELRVQH